MPREKDTFEGVSHAQRTVARQIKEKLMGTNQWGIVENFLGNCGEAFAEEQSGRLCFSLMLDERCDVHDTTHMLIFLHGITADLQIMEELKARHPIKRTTIGND